MRLICVYLFVAFMSILAGPFASAGEVAMSGTAAAGDFKLFSGGAAAGILYDADDFKVVGIAARAFSADVQLVTGKKPVVATAPKGLGKNAVIAGTIGKSRYIDALIKSKKIDASRVKGKWEAFVIAVVRAPMKGIDSALVVAGSDRRGTAFGLFELSGMIGVSPWVWWADVSPEKKAALIVKKGVYAYGGPSVKYRGVFLNDEAFGLQPWAAKTYEPETGDIGPKTYARIFELLLRLKANYIWPAMKKCTKAFNYYDKNKYVADNYAIVMGSSHCEQMLRDNIFEWHTYGEGSWDFTTNREGVLKYWDKRVEENGRFENIYTLGMRGIDDTGMPGGGTLEEQTRRLEEIIAAQRDMIRRHVNPKVETVPQLFSPYKEVLDLYRNNLKLPDDITILWTDDNYGYIRRLPTPEEQKRSGGHGVYYHISYSGRPHDYLWLNTTPPALIFEEMRKAYDYGARRIWVVNCGDIKPGEIGIEFFLQMAWNIDRWNYGTQADFLRQWAEREFGVDYSRAISEIMEKYYLLGFQRKPEHMGFNEIELPNTVVRDPEFSLFNYGDEAKKRMDAYDDIEKKATAVYDSLPADKKDAYYQLVLYPVRGATFMNRKTLYAYRSRVYAKLGRVSANDYAAMSDAAYNDILKETAYFNEKMAGGKWNGMMSHRQHDRLVFNKIKTGKVEPQPGAVPAVMVEGQSKPALEASELKEDLSLNSLPDFELGGYRSFFVDIYNKGSDPFTWTAKSDADWIKLSKTSGEVTTEERLCVNVDFDSIGKSAKLTISIGDKSFPVFIKLNSGVSVRSDSNYFIDNGVISIDAAPEYVDNWKVERAVFKSIKGLGRSGSALMMLSPTAPLLADKNRIMADAPYAEYRFFSKKSGKAKVTVEALPTHEITGANSLKCALSVGDGKPVIVEFQQGNDEFDKVWRPNALRNMMSGTVEMEIPQSGYLRLWALDPSVIVDRIIIDFGGLKQSYLGPEETTPMSGIH